MGVWLCRPWRLRFSTIYTYSGTQTVLEQYSEIRNRSYADTCHRNHRYAHGE